MEKDELGELVRKVLGKTAGYYADGYMPGPDGRCIHIHSMSWLHDHPERINTPEYTEDEEKEFNQHIK